MRVPYPFIASCIGRLSLGSHSFCCYIVLVLCVRIPVGGFLESLTGREMPTAPGKVEAYFAKIMVKAPPASFLS